MLFGAKNLDFFFKYGHKQALLCFHLSAKEPFGERLCGIFRRIVLAFGDIYKNLTNLFCLLAIKI